jgi:ABC-type lipoprotein export system ATPase subunit
VAGAPGAQPVIMIRDLRFRYPGSGEDVLRVPFLDVPATGMTAVTGPSGPAKSALIELLAGTLREPYEGTVYVLGAEWRSLTRDADRQRQLRRIGLIPQDYGLSGGQRHRVAIARMLARHVECVIADDPTANLDPALAAETMSLFRCLAGHVPVIIITHDPAVAAACDRTVALRSAVTGPAGAAAPAPARRVPPSLAAIIAVCLLAIAGITAVIVIPAPGQSSGGPAAKTGALPALTVGGWTGTDPSTIGFSADGGNIVTGIIWSSWTATGARGRGTSYLDNCVPNCAQGTTTAVPATITLSDPAGGRFTVIKERRAGATTIFTYSGFWPLNAS